MVGPSSSHRSSLCCRLGYRHAGLLAGLSQALTWKKRKFRGQALANLTWALAEFKWVQGGRQAAGGRPHKQGRGGLCAVWEAWEVCAGPAVASPREAVASPGGQ